MATYLPGTTQQRPELAKVAAAGRAEGPLSRARGAVGATWWLPRK